MEATTGDLEDKVAREIKGMEVKEVMEEAATLILIKTWTPRVFLEAITRAILRAQVPMQISVWAVETTLWVVLANQTIL